MKWCEIVQEMMISKPIDKEVESKIKNNTLYHVTQPEFALNIMKHNYFRTTSGTIHIQGLSTTFDQNYVWGRGGFKFLLDYNKLKKDFKLLFIDEGLNGIDESEIKIINDGPIMNANKYVKSIEYHGNDPEIKQMIKKFMRK